jgi:DNA-binding transcriptional LysR family regulator
VAYRAIVSNFEASFRVVAANLAISVIPMEVGTAYATLLGVKVIPLTDSWAHRQFVVCFTDYETLQPATRRLVDRLTDSAQKAAAAG